MIKIGKSKKITRNDLSFLSSIVNALPSKYKYLSGQVNRDFLLKKRINVLGSKETYTIVLNADLEKKYSIPDMPKFFILKRIEIWNNSRKKFEDIELHIIKGMLAGFKVESKYNDLDLCRIKSDNISEKHFAQEIQKKVANILRDVNEEILSLLDIRDSIEIEFDNKFYYTIKNLGNGNYLALNDSGSIFGLIHDPFEIELLFKSKETFVEAIKSKRFNIDEYLSKKLK
ncbi:MAG: hypothetical protein GY756_27880 [bacterium]|nr:hypothetical protein [bacterium]